MIVPARVGGVDLSLMPVVYISIFCCPRPCGRGGFKLRNGRVGPLLVGPRPCGRGGFKPNYFLLVTWEVLSPPVWAGWI